MTLELFHRLAEAESAAARTLVRDLGLVDAVAFRNVAFASHAADLAARGGARTPALWDGARLHEGLDAIRAALATVSGPPSPRDAAREDSPERGEGRGGALLPPAPAALLDASGAPHLGAFRGASRGLDLARLARPGLAGRLRHLARAKSWVWAVAVSDEALAAVAIVEAGYFAGGFAWVLDRRRGEMIFEGSAAGLPRRHAWVEDGAGASPRARLATRGLNATVAPDGATLRLTAEAGDAFRLDAVLDPSAAPAPFTLVAPVPGGGVRATTKAAGLGARGTVRAGGRTLSLDGGAGGLDVTAGLLARETAWRWAFATGRVAGRPFGLNLCEGFGVGPADPGENAGFLGAPYRLPAVAFAVGGTDSRAPWRIAGAGVDLVFRPAGAHREARNLVLVRTRFAQVAGAFEGHVPGPDGAPVRLEGVPGVVEDHWARW